MPLAETSKANSATPSANPVKANPSSLLQPVQQWQAHETMVTSVEGVNYRGKLDLLVTAGVDSYVHLWTVDGAHVGTFGQVLPKYLHRINTRAVILTCVTSIFLFFELFLQGFLL